MTHAEAIREILSAHAEVPGSDDAELSLPSLVVVVLAEELEAKFGFTVAARELLPENFGTIARLAAYVGRKVGA